MDRNTLQKITLLAAAIVSLNATAAVAQVSTDAQSQTDDAPVIENIVVTARRRAESLLDVPVSVSAVSAETLERTGAIDLTSVAQTIPNVTLAVSRGSNTTLTAFIRGIGQADPVAGFETGVGIYLDDVYLNRPQAAVLDIYDVERIEVLRGPQGTLYGRNTIGGALKYVTRRLPDEFSVAARATYGSYDQADAVLSVSAPIGDAMRVGGSVARLTRNGFGENHFLGIDNYDKDILAGRTSLEFGGPADRLELRLSGDYSIDESNVRNSHRFLPGLLSGAPVLSDVYDTRAGLSVPEQKVEAYGVALSATVTLSDTLKLRSITAWRSDVSDTTVDFDSLPTEDADGPAIYKNEQTSEELQLLYEGSRLNGIVGLYALEARAGVETDLLLTTTGELLGQPGLNSYTKTRIRTETWSIFADFTYELNDAFSLSVGGRYTADERLASILRQNKNGGLSPVFGGTAFPVSTITDFDGTAKFNEFNPRASLSYKPDEDHMIYVSYAQGFKGGGFDPRGNALIAPDADRNGVRSYQEIFDFFLFDPESVSSYELGWKGSLADDAITVMLTGFFADYEDVQIPGNVGVDANGDGVFESYAGVTTNAAKAQYTGVEAETFARFASGFAGAGSGFSLNSTVGYIEPDYERFLVSGIDVSDFRTFQNTPQWTASTVLGAHFRSASGEVNASTTLAYRSKVHLYDRPSPFLDQADCTLWDASVVWTSDDERWNAGLHVKNLTDKRYMTSGYQFLTVNPDGSIPLNSAGRPTSTLGREGAVAAYYGNPRQIFATVGVKF